MREKKLKSNQNSIIMTTLRLIMKHLLLSYCLFIVCACSDTYKKSWQDELRATPEYAEILQLRSAMFAEDPLTKPNSELDKYIEKLSDQ